MRRAEPPRAARWRLPHFLRHAREQIGFGPLFEAVAKALETVEKHAERIFERWRSTHGTARMEAMNRLFQAARARGMGYRNTATFITMIYLITAPLGDIEYPEPSISTPRTPFGCGCRLRAARRWRWHS
ncbi:MAG: transposase [Alphaproteobacteria bacterium]|nr:transposase [Alphaproteobacteria bacterium]